MHFDGQIWSQALWEIRLGYVALGLATRDWDTTLIASQFGYAPDTSFAARPRKTYEHALDPRRRAPPELVKDSSARGITR